MIVRDSGIRSISNMFVFVRMSGISRSPGIGGMKGSVPVAMKIFFAPYVSPPTPMCCASVNSAVPFTSVTFSKTFMSFLSLMPWIFSRTIRIGSEAFSARVVSMP